MALISVAAFETLDRLSRHVPQALSTYLTCLVKSDDEGVCHLTKEIVEDTLLSSWVRTKNHLRILAREGVLDYAVEDKSFVVHVLEQDFLDVQHL